MKFKPGQLVILWIGGSLPVLLFLLGRVPVGARSFNDTATYSNKDPPLQVAALKSVRVHCPKTGRHYAQRDDNKVFLVPLT